MAAALGNAVGGVIVYGTFLRALTTFDNNGIISTGLAGALFSYKAISYVIATQTPLSSVVGTGALLFSLTALVFTATDKIFDMLSIEEGCLRSCLTWTFTLLYSLPISFAAATSFGLSSSIGDSILLSTMTFYGTIGLMALATSVAMAVEKIIRVRQAHYYQQ
jgi:hypothetical protein